MHTRKRTNGSIWPLPRYFRRVAREVSLGSETDNESLRPNTIEETYELCDALMKDDKKDICKELGDVLLHVAFMQR